MIIYNVTIKVNHSIAAAWLTWLKDEHIPDVTGTGCFNHATILHLIEADDEEGMTYAVQYHAESKGLYNRYIEIFADEIRKKGIEKWGNQFIAYRTVMQVVN
ncbi:MAG: DUF4286 family protein [Chitinophagaceae bacterium]|nr:DUF4286 family protein [Chitinophagaceae bacterium]